MGGARSEDTILRATLDLVAEHGVSGVTVDAVAARARVGKATIYRHWGSRARLVHDAISCMKDPVEEPNTGTLHGDLVSLVRQVVNYLQQEDTARVLPSLLDAAVRDPELAELRIDSSRHRRAFFERAVEHAVERGELSKDVDVQLLIDLVVAPFFYRRLMALSQVRTSDVEP